MQVLSTTKSKKPAEKQLDLFFLNLYKDNSANNSNLNEVNKRSMQNE